jgi:hypothetical protein
MAVDQNNGQRQRTFDPNEHIMQLKSKEGSKDYLPVQWRVVWFRERCPDGTIDTEEICVDLDREVEEEVFVWNNEKRRSEKVVKRAKGYARFKAVVTDGKGGRATGTKSENAASFPDFVEKAETGAIGRALAALGYGTAFAPEFNEAHRIVDSPVERATGNSEGERVEVSHPLANANATTSEPVPPSLVEKHKASWASTYTIADDQVEERWGKYKVYILGSDIADPDLKAAHLGRINGDIETQRRKAPKAS